jgi:hypothetical protein
MDFASQNAERAVLNTLHKRLIVGFHTFSFVATIGIHGGLFAAFFAYM